MERNSDCYLLPWSQVRLNELDPTTATLLGAPSLIKADKVTHFEPCVL